MKRDFIFYLVVLAVVAVSCKKSKEYIHTTFTVNGVEKKYENSDYFSMNLCGASTWCGHFHKEPMVTIKNYMKFGIPGDPVIGRVYWNYEHVCQGAQGIVYSVAAVPGATGYVWTTSPGATIVNGTNTNVITVNFSNSATSGNFRVYGTSPCGNGPNSPALYVIVNAKPPNPIIGPSTDGVANIGDTLFSSIPEGNQWYLNGEEIQGANDSLLVAQWAGDYFTIIDNGVCVSDTSNHIIAGTTGVENQETLNFTVYPVPNDGRFTAGIITSHQETFRIMVYNKLGQMIFEQKDVIADGVFRKVIDLRPIPNGIYTVVFLSDDHKVIRKVVVNL